MADRKTWTDNELRDLFSICRKDSDSIWEHFPDRSIDSILYAVRRFHHLNDSSNNNIYRNLNIKIPNHWYRIWEEEKQKINSKKLDNDPLIIIFSIFIIYLSILILGYTNNSYSDITLENDTINITEINDTINDTMCDIIDMNIHKNIDINDWL